MAFTHRHLLGLEGLSPRRADLPARHGRLVQGDLGARHQEGADAARQDGRQPVLRSQHAHAHLVRDRRQAPERRLRQPRRRRPAAPPRARRCSTRRATSRPCGPTRSSCATPPPGAPHFLAARIDCPIINAGDGAHEHPTQALLDLLTIREHKGRLDGLTVAIVGDILHSRVARSNVFALRTLGAPRAPRRPADAAAARSCAPGARSTTTCDDGVRDADVIMMLRIQRERQGKQLLPEPSTSTRATSA